MIQTRTCRKTSCGRSFQGGPRAYYCPTCRAERQRIAGAASKARARKGLTRKIGSIDTCERCGKDYNVNAPLQRFCQDCQPVHALEYDRETSLPFYHDNKEKINPVRNARRRVGYRDCNWCGQEFEVSGTRVLTCSDECEKQRNKKLARVKYHEERGSSEIKRCVICEKEFTPTDRSVTCSENCHRTHKNKIALNYYHKKKAKLDD